MEIEGRTANVKNTAARRNERREAIKKAAKAADKVAKAKADKAAKAKAEQKQTKQQKKKLSMWEEVFYLNQADTPAEHLYEDILFTNDGNP